MNRNWTTTGGLAALAAIALTASSLGQATSPDTEEQTALERVAKANKYAFLFFFRDDNERTRTARATLEAGVDKLSNRAELIVLDVTADQDRATVDAFGVRRAPMPLIVAVAPTGAVTKSWFRNFDKMQLEDAFVSPCEARCLKAFQDRRLVMVCVQNDKTTHNDVAMKGVREFTADARYAPQTEVVAVDPSDEAEAALLSKLRVSPDTKEAVTVLMAPPGRPIGTFTGATSKAAFVAAITKAGAGCDPSTGCCPPKKATAKKPSNDQ